MANVKDVSAADFEKEVLQSPVPVLVDFWAPWCGPCRQIAPVLESLAAANVGKVKVVKVNVDDNGELAGKYDVRGIPTLLLIKGGAEINRSVGSKPEKALRNWLEDALDAAKTGPAAPRAPKPPGLG